MKNKIYIFFLLLFPVAAVMAENVPFRSGIILAAELSSAPQKILDFEEADYPNLPVGNRLYAAVTLKLCPGRQLSRHDYSLSITGSPNPCVAIRVDNGPWKSVSGDIEYAEPNKKYAMLFILDSHAAGMDDVEKHGLKCNYPPAQVPETQFYFTNRRKQNFTPASKIPARGIVAVKK